MQGSRGGFALAVVVLLLFAIGTLGATAYPLVMNMATVSRSVETGTRALGAAQGGMVRFVSEQTDTVDSVAYYTIGDADAEVRARLLGQLHFPNRLYYLRSTGSYLDARSGQDVAERTVGQVALHWRAPLHALGALVSPSDHIDVENMTAIQGEDMATSADCSEAPVDPVAGIVGGGDIHIRDDDSWVTGSPKAVSYGTPQAVLDSLGVDWSAFTDPDFDVEYEDQWPYFPGMSPDNFPTIRINGDLDAYSYYSGWGLLIVTGDLRLYDDFEWDGVILVGDMNDETDYEDFTIRGLLAVGLDGVGERFRYRGQGTIRFHSCNVLAAGRKIAQLEPVDRTWWEMF